MSKRKSQKKGKASEPVEAPPPVAVPEPPSPPETLPAVIEQLGTRARMTLTGLELAEDLTVEEFEQLFRTFVRLRDAERWALGDAINGFARHRGVRDEGLYR